MYPGLHLAIRIRCLDAVQLGVRHGAIQQLHLQQLDALLRGLQRRLSLRQLAI